VHHLRALERGRLVRKERDGARLRFYSSGAEARPGFAAEVLAPLQASILRALAARPGLSQAALADELGVSRQALNYHVQRLRRAGSLDAASLRPASGSARRVVSCARCARWLLVPADASVACPACGAPWEDEMPREPCASRALPAGGPVIAPAARPGS
jgi:DNA-binding transcriptional ArsR family regulator